ncbi:hypothetical protein Leryth_005783 [Lithospermum erythrorhizon]|nr:hypothetical protein Leryth_005783 [Lithospermum erythrorhizon]
MESAIDQVQVGSGFFDAASAVIGTVVELVKPGINVALPIFQRAGEQALKIVSPFFSEASKSAQQAMQSSGFDTQPVMTAAKLTPAQTLDLMCTRNYIMIDIRSEKDKGKNGVPRLPSSAYVVISLYSDSAKIVAKTLTNLGFKNCWIVTDGFSGSNGWLQSRLGTDSYNFSSAEVLLPSRVIPAAARRFGTTSSAKLLPGSSE